MLSVKEKLKFLDRDSSKVAAQIKNNTLEADQLHDLDAELIKEGSFHYILRQKKYDAQFVHGGIPVEQFSSIEPNLLKYIAGDPELKEYSIHDYAFVDTETTGLAGGTGTYLFLIGIGFIEKDQFVIQQYLLPDLDNESFMMQALSHVLSQYQGLITYNGKSYDIPLLRTRLLLNRKDVTDLESKQHIDVLHCARRLWKRFTRCDLQSIEAEILGFARKDDIPGKDIPELYFNFLKDKNLGPLKSVLKHNVIDILSMASIIVRAGKLVFNKDNAQATQRTDKHALFKLYNRMGETDRALAVVKQGENRNTESIDLSMDHALLLKRTGNYENANEIWRTLTLNKNICEKAFLELAKYYEHKTNDYEEALKIVNAVIKRIEISKELFTERNAEYCEDWNHRRARILKKMAAINV